MKDLGAVKDPEFESEMKEKYKQKREDLEKERSSLNDKIKKDQEKMQAERDKIELELKQRNDALKLKLLDD